MPLFGPPNIEQLQIDKDVAGLINALSYEKDWHIRQQAAGALGQLGHVQAVLPLIEALRDGYWPVRQSAAAALGMIGDPRAIDPLVAALKQADATLRLAAAESLSTLGWHPNTPALRATWYVATREWGRCVALGPAATRPLITILRDWNPQIRSTVAKALGQLSDPQAVVPLVDLFFDTDPQVRRAVIKALCKIGEPAVKPLITVLAKGGGNTPGMAAEALICIGGAALDLLHKAFHIYFDDLPFQLAVIDILGRIGDNWSVEPLLDVAHSHYKQWSRMRKPPLGWTSADWDSRPDRDFKRENDHIEVFRAALAAAVRIQPEGKEAVILLALQQPVRHEGSLYAESLKVLGDIGIQLEDAIPTALQSDNPDLRFAAARELEKIGKVAAVEPLIATLHDVHVEVRLAVVRALERIGDERAISALVEVLFDTSSEVRRAAARALEGLNTPLIIDPIIVALQDDDVEVRHIAVRTLRRIGGERSLEALITRLDDADFGVCRAVVDAVAWIGGGQALAALIDALEYHPDAEMRQVIIRALADMDRPADVSKLVDSLIHQLNAAESVIRVEAACALGRIGDKRAAEAVIRVMFQDNHTPWSPACFEKLFGDYANLISRAAYRVLGDRRESSKYHKLDLVEAVYRLSKINTPVSSNILYKVSQREEYFGASSIEDCKMVAHNALLQRGNPSYDASTYLNEKAWELPEMV
ncbi:MAG: HEAT repeat domain-containing protein [Anaerolineae bacterium]|nr:HEAT repeat domain-containing protein [Anaerolineae bacterium]